MTPGTDTRSLAPLVGLILLVGLVSLASVTIVAVGVGSLADAEDDAERERLEGGFQQLGHDVDTVAGSSAARSRTDLAVEAGSVAVDPGAGSLSIERVRSNATLFDAAMPALEHRDGSRRLAYQSGGVFSHTPDGTETLTAPSLRLRGGTLGVTLADLEPNGRAVSDRVTVTETESTAATATEAEPGMLQLTVRSRYYRGWAAHLGTEIGDSHVTVDHANESVSVTVGRPVADGDFEDSLVSAGNVTTGAGNACINGTVAADGDVDADDCDGGDATEASYDELEPIDDVIAYLFEQAEDRATPLGDVDYVDDGVYNASELHREQDPLTIDVSAGNVTLLVDGPIGLDGEGIEVVGAGSGNVARIYTTGDIALGGRHGSVTVDGAGPEAFQVYGTSTMYYAQGQGDFTGTVYAPRTEPADGTNDAAAAYGISSADNCDGEDVCFGQGSGTFTGAIVSGDVHFEQSTDLRYPPTLVDVQPNLSPEGFAYPPAVDHVNVRVVSMTVESE